MPNSWLYTDPTNPPSDGWYFFRWARRQQVSICLLQDGEIWITGDRRVLSWREFIVEWGRQYWPEPVVEPPDLWIDHMPGDDK